MSVIDDVRKDREDLARVLKKHVGIRKIVEDLYPDSAHFIFELLQNAEDRGATEVHFRLSATSLRFEHNGETFRHKDIEGITDIGEGTKAGDDDKIGRFGVGFKSVFAYSETPHIWSPTFSFKISDLVLPWELPPASDLAALTRFDFPFDNPKKAPADAYREIASGLDELAETALLFLRQIETIQWHVEGRQSGTIMRIEHRGPHVEVLKQMNGTTTTSAHFLKFEQPVPGLGNNRTAAVAYALDFLPNITSFAADKPLSRQLRIVPVSGQVAVFFPAAKETSGLRFHVHAPFVPELSRASIKETPANKPLFAQLATLAASSLHQIRDLGLLVPDFLGVLPNPEDALGPRYIGIRDAIVAAMNYEPLTPTYAKAHAPAQKLVQAKAALKDLLGADDIEFLIDSDDEPPQWAASRALQGTNVERFMNGLAIEEWDVDAFIDVVAKNAKGGSSTAYAAFEGWLSAKSVEWHQQFYALLVRENDGFYDISRLRQCHIVRLAGGGYSTGVRCHFASERGDRADGVPYVDPAVYTAGKSKADQEAAKKLLAELGVSEVGERELVNVLLQSTYTGRDPVKASEHLAHLRRFMKFLEQDPSHADLLSSFPIFVGADGKWHKPADIFLDGPYLETGLRDFLAIPKASRPLHELADFYKGFRVDVPKIVRFVENLGGHTTIALSKVSCTENPEWDYLRRVPGQRYTNHIDRDFTIAQFKQLVAKKSERLSRLVWNTLRALEAPSYDSIYAPSPLRAAYQMSDRWGARFADSQLVHQLRREAWVPQKGGAFVRPPDAHADLLPGGFTFDQDWPWIEAIKFGENVALQDARVREEAAANAERAARDDEVAKSLGFEDADTARSFAEIPPLERRRMIADWHRRRPTELPDHQPSNPDRRAERVKAAAATAPKRQTEVRERWVAVERDSIKGEAKQYLRQLYANGDSEQFCQICKDVLPFKLADGSFYFEAVELLPELERHHRENYLCLCPNHAAMFQYANGSKPVLREAIKTLAGNHLPVVLAQQDATIYFTATHLLDLRTILAVDSGRVKE